MEITVNKNLILEKQHLLKRLEEIDNQIGDNLYRTKNNIPQEAKMTDEITQPVEKVVKEKPKFTIAERKAKVLEMLKDKKDLKEIMATVEVSNTYVYKVKKENGLL